MSIQGKVKWFNEKKGYGFIVAPDGRDVFTHYSQILGGGFQTLMDGESVTYDLVEDAKGPMAKNITRDPLEVARGNLPPLERRVS